MQERSSKNNVLDSFNRVLTGKVKSA